MRADFARDRTQGLALAVQFGLVVSAIAIGTRSALLIGLFLLAAVSLAAWIGTRRRVRFMEDTATSKVASAAQGYVELLGRAEQFDAAPTLSPYTGLPCVWFCYRVERRGANNQWSHLESRRSEQPFRLLDETGSCLVDPQGAEVFTSRIDTWVKDGYRYTEQLLLAKDHLYAIGEFTSCSATTSDFELKAEATALLADWKQDRVRLVARFDKNRDGEIDLEEWESARAEARAEALARHRESRLRDGPHLMRRPRDGRLYLLSNLQPRVLARRAARMAWIHLVLLVGAAAVIGWLASNP